jgi:hypothetical protein
LSRTAREREKAINFYEGESGNREMLNKMFSDGELRSPLGISPYGKNRFRERQIDGLVSEKRS